VSNKSRHCAHVSVLYEIRLSESFPFVVELLSISGAPKTLLPRAPMWEVGTSEYPLSPL
jgi:hypothetical protein